MPFSSDSSTAGRRNIFDAAAPALAATDGAGERRRSIFDAAAPTSTTVAAGSEDCDGRLRMADARLLKPRAAARLAIAALISVAAAVLSVTVASTAAVPVTNQEERP